MKKILIGFAGPAGVGKDTAADYLANGAGLMRYALADPIKNALDAMGFARSLYDQDDVKDKPIFDFGVSYRKLAQTLGTEWGRSIVPDFWLRVAERTFRSLETRNDGPLKGSWRGMVVSDVRFENEAAWVRREGLLIHIIGPSRRPIANDGAAHASEAGIEKLQGDVLVTNTGSLTFMLGQVEQAYAHYARSLR